MEKRAICFTGNGKALLEKLNEKYREKGMEEAVLYGWPEDYDLAGWTKEGFEAGACLIFVSAVGIAVRAVSGIARDKLKDSPVIVIDDNGQFVIPILSGHVGGGNKIALTIAELLGAVPVITTSTDVNDAFSADLFAKEQNLLIQNREGIKKVSAKAIEGKAVTLSVKHFPPNEAVDVLVSDVADAADAEYSLLLSPKPYLLGVGTKKGKDVKEAEEFLLSLLEKQGISVGEIYAVCSADRKEEEECIKAFCEKYRIPFLTFDADILNEAKGEFTDSDYVRSTIGVGNVCERAAMVASMNRGEVILKKQTGDGITAAIVRRKMNAAVSPADKKNGEKGCIFVVGLGPGKEGGITKEADEALRNCDVIAGYKTYIDLIKDRYPEKEFFENGMKMEIDRCKACLELAKEGKKVALIGSGDAGVYGMASPMLEVGAENGFTDIEIIPGVSAALSGAAILGAPIGHDFCTISLSDLLTPWEVIENRLRAAAQGDFCIALYNPSSHKRKDYLKKACEILLEILSEDTVCGLAKNIGRDGETTEILSLKELKDYEADMFTTVFIGNSKTKKCGNYMVTPRGYRNE